MIWLAETVGKPILKLTEEDYNNHGMAQLAVEQGPVYNINIDIFNQIQHTITGWPGGKPDADDTPKAGKGTACPKALDHLLASPGR